MQISAYVSLVQLEKCSLGQGGISPVYLFVSQIECHYTPVERKMTSYHVSLIIYCIKIYRRYVCTNVCYCVIQENTEEVLQSCSS